jgi:hypothetical protein
MLKASRKTRALTAALAVVLALGVFAASAGAVTAKFFGVVPQSNLSQENFTTLKQGGVKEMRVAMIWGGMQPTRGGAINWGEFDGQVERAAKSGIELLPFIVGTPAWAVPSVNVPGAPGAKAPARLPISGSAGTAWSTFLKAAVARYGTDGTFWAENPTVPVKPIKAWQIWNEPNFKYFVAHPNPAEYGKLVKLSATAVKSTDPTAQVILAGLFAKPAGARYLKGKKVMHATSPNYFGSYFLEQMYRTNPGIKSSFQGVALHPYVARYRQLPQEIEELRGVMTREGDAAKGLWVTELGLGTAAGPVQRVRGRHFRPGTRTQRRLHPAEPGRGEIQAPARLLVLGRRRCGNVQLLQRLGPVQERFRAEAVLDRIHEFHRRHPVTTVLMGR